MLSRLLGYVVPGCVFFLFGIKWAYDFARVSRDWRWTVDRMGSDAESQSTRRNRRCCNSGVSRYPLEGIVKLFVTAIGILASVVMAYPDGTFQYVGDILYATIYLFFALSGLVDVLAYYCTGTISRGFARLALAQAFFMEGFLFYLALSTQAVMERLIHTLLVYAIWGAALATVIEGVFLGAGAVRCICTILHGSWFIQSGILLHWPREKDPSWDTSVDFNKELVWISLAFAWHAAGSFVVLLVMLVIRRGCRKKPPPIPRYGFSHGHTCDYCNVYDIAAS